MADMKKKVVKKVVPKKPPKTERELQWEELEKVLPTVPVPDKRRMMDAFLTEYGK